MKSVSLLAAALLIAGAANAQGPTNQYGGPSPHPINPPANLTVANKGVDGPKEGIPSNVYTDYSQDSYVNQVGNGNTATVDQMDYRSSKANGGSTAILNQTGDYNTATQSQTLTTTPFSNDVATNGGRNFVKSTQAGTYSQSNQTQNGGGYNSAIVNQGAGTTGNRAIQTQNIDGTGGDGNQATINQTYYQDNGPGGNPGSGSHNRAEQTQVGHNQGAEIDQESTNSFAQQTQSGGSLPPTTYNTAYIHQGEPGDANTAKQMQSGGSANAASIFQSVGSVANNNYAEQNQKGDGNQATIVQESNKNYAEQMQVGSGNVASTLQQKVSSASYISQNGMANMATVTQK